jgi:hypothetical protein
MKRMLGMKSVGPALGALLLAAAAAPAHAQGINTSRLGLAKAPGVVARGVLQLEAGYSRGMQAARTRQTFGEVVLRVGLGANTEARLGVPSYQTLVTAADTLSGSGDASFALKHRLFLAHGLRPALALVAGTTLPTGAKAMSAGQVQPELSASAEWLLAHGVRAITMVTHRDAVAAGDRYGLNTLAGGLRLTVAPPAMLQLEYGRVTSTRTGASVAKQVRAGAALRLTPTLQLDGWMARASSAGKAETQLGLGFARSW